MNISIPIDKSTVGNTINEKEEEIINTIDISNDHNSAVDIFDNIPTRSHYRSSKLIRFHHGSSWLIRAH